MDGNAFGRREIGMAAYGASLGGMLMVAPGAPALMALLFGGLILLGVQARSMVALHAALALSIGLLCVAMLGAIVQSYGLLPVCAVQLIGYLLMDAGERRDWIEPLPARVAARPVIQLADESRA